MELKAVEHSLPPTSRFQYCLPLGGLSILPGPDAPVFSVSAGIRTTRDSRSESTSRSWTYQWPGGNGDITRISWGEKILNNPIPCTYGGLLQRLAQIEPVQLPLEPLWLKNAQATGQSSRLQLLPDEKECIQAQPKTQPNPS